MSILLDAPAFETPTLATCPLQLSDAQKAQFERDGFIAFADVLSPSEVEAARGALRQMVDGLRPQHRTLKSPQGQMWVALDSTLQIQFQNGFEPHENADSSANEADFETDFDSVRKFASFIDVEPVLTQLARVQERIQGVLTSLIGPDALLIQDMALINPPGIGTGKPWHQDDAYFSVAPLDAVCGVWIALDTANAENGAMNFLPGWHKGGALRHFHGSDCEIAPENLDGAVPVAAPLPPGGAVFFCGIAPHMTHPNTSDQRRRALQFHYRAQDSQVLDRPEYDEIFATADGTPASCAAAAKRGF